MNNYKPILRQSTEVPLLALLFASGMGAFLVVLRMLWVRELSYMFLIWNLFLAWIPLFFALEVCRRHQAGESGRSKLYLMAGLWLLFFPNAPYIFTDLIHLKFFRQHYWLDLSLILHFALTGFLLGFISLYLMQSVVAARLGRAASWLFILVVAGLSGLGVYIGRFLRWNSWDIFLNPVGITRDLSQLAFHPRANARSIAFTLLFAAFLFLGYVMLYALTHLQPARNEHENARL